MAGSSRVTRSAGSVEHVERRGRHRARRAAIPEEHRVRGKLLEAPRRRVVLQDPAHDVAADAESLGRADGLGGVPEVAEHFAGALGHQLGRLAKAHPVEQTRARREKGDRDEQGHPDAGNRPRDARARGLRRLRRPRPSRARASRPPRAPPRADRRPAAPPRPASPRPAAAPGPSRGSAGSRARRPGPCPATIGGRRGRRVLGVLLARSPAIVAASNARLPGEELVEDEAERVEVAPDRRALAGELLGRHVGGRAREVVVRRPRSPATAARPKSVMRARPRPSSMTLAGLRSRCSTPWSCAAARPAQSWRAISSALSGGSRPMRLSSDARSSPSTYSMERKCWPSTSPMS